jgi:hypothetical protein
MNCNELQEHYELFAMGVAEEPERGEIREHLNRQCEVCMNGVKNAMEVSALLGSTVDAAQPSAALRRRILAAVGVEQRRFSWTPLWALATALALVASFYFGRQQQRFAAEAQDLRAQMRQQSVELTRLTEAFAILNAPDTREAAFGTGQRQPPRGKVYVNPSQGVLLMATNLPPAPSGKLYEMWVIPRGRNPVPAGLFQSMDDGSALHVQRGAVDVAATGAVAVTVEDARGALQPTTQPLIVAALANLPLR